MWTSRDEQEMIAFWKARLDQDEQVARGCAGNGEWDAEDIAIYGKDLAPDVRTHMAHHDPARVLRDVSAARQRLAKVDEAIGAGHDSYDLASALLPLELAPYANHPDYNEAWRP
jgi:hypothetical protein